MWILKSIKATNIQTIKEVDYTLEQGVTTLLFGQNNDNPTQKSNGSGKSAILEAISLGTRGTAIRPVRIDEMINNDESKATTDITYFNEDTGVSMTISREFFKKSSNTVSLYMEADGKPLPENDYIQSSASEYSMFIFEQLGVTEDEFMNNFLLSKHRYTSFFDSTDKEKKDIINNLSNATVVDPSMDKVEEDIEDSLISIKSIDMKMSSNSGATSAISEQIEIAKKSEIDNPKKDRIEKMEAQLNESKSTLIEQKEKLDNTQTTGFNISEVAKVIEDIIFDGDSKDWREAIKNTVYDTSNPDALVLDEYFRRKLDELETNSREDAEKLKMYESELDKCNNELKENSSDLSKLSLEKNELELKVEAENKSFLENSEEVNASLLEVNKKLSNLSEYYLDLQSEISTFAKRGSVLKNIVSGKIECPKCHHEFLLSKDINLEDAQRELNEVETSISEKEKLALETETSRDSKQSEKKSLDIKVRDLEKEKLQNISSIRAKISELDKSMNTINAVVREINSNISTIERSISTVSVRMSKYSSVLKDEMYDEIDRIISKNNKEEQSISQNISYINAQIDTYISNIKKIEETDVDTLVLNLEDSKRKLVHELVLLTQERAEAQVHNDSLTNQLNIFKSFKTHLANSKIEALAYEINYFLEKVGTDVRVSLSGYTKNKSGKISDKIYTSIIRDGVDFGSLYKLSEGEKATIHLATILARQKLINGSTDAMKGLNFLCIDEILDSIDYGGLAKIFDTLNASGVTAIIISHGNILEGYPHVLKIEKTDGISELVE